MQEDEEKRMLYRIMDREWPRKMMTVPLTMAGTMMKRMMNNENSQGVPSPDQCNPD
jgi:hypothetical protein